MLEIIHSVIIFYAFIFSLKQAPCVLPVRQDLQDSLDLFLGFLPSRKEGRKLNPPVAENNSLIAL